MVWVGVAWNQAKQAYLDERRRAKAAVRQAVPMLCVWQQASELGCWLLGVGCCVLWLTEDKCEAKDTKKMEEEDGKVTVPYRPCGRIRKN